MQDEQQGTQTPGAPAPTPDPAQGGMNMPPTGTDQPGGPTDTPMDPATGGVQPSPTGTEEPVQTPPSQPNPNPETPVTPGM